jgi:hypothetical protein
MLEAGKPTWHAPWAHQTTLFIGSSISHSPTPPIHLLGFCATDTNQVPPPSDSTIDHAHSSLIPSRAGPPSPPAHRPGSPDPGDVHRQFRVELAHHRPWSQDAPGAAPTPLGWTLHHESSDPPGDAISTPWAGSVPCSPPPRHTSLLGGPPP